MARAGIQSGDWRTRDRRARRTRSGRRLVGRWRPLGVRAVIVAALFFSSAFPGAADLAVLTNGHVLKIGGFEVAGEMARLALVSGGTLVVPLTVIERVLDDEIVPEPQEALPVPDRLTLGFSEQAAAPETPFGDLIHQTAERHGVSSELVAAMVRAESAFDPRAVSHKGARGLLQLMPATAIRFGVQPEELFDPRKNLEAGVKYLRWLIGRYPETPSLVLAAYNAGEGSVDRYEGVPPYRETRNYIRRVYSSLGLEADSALEATR